MLDHLQQLFSWVCGQSQSHTWSPGGEALPCCQRCTGVYVGALVAALVHLAWRPVPTLRWLGLNGVFLFFILPSGFYWIPQNPELRCASGILFSFGLVAYLRLCLRRSGPENFPERNSLLQIVIFMAALLACLVLTPLLAENGNARTADFLGAASFGGALVLAALLLANVFLAACWFFSRFRAVGRRCRTITLTAR